MGADSNSLAQFRFKTEEELISQYGPNFRGVIAMNTNGLMDYLMGTPLSKEFSSALSKGLPIQVKSSPNGNCWSISSAMVTPIIEDKLSIIKDRRLLLKRKK